MLYIYDNQSVHIYMKPLNDNKPLYTRCASNEGIVFTPKPFSCDRPYVCGVLCIIKGIFYWMKHTPSIDSIKYVYWVCGMTEVCLVTLIFLFAVGPNEKTEHTFRRVNLVVTFNVFENGK